MVRISGFEYVYTYDKQGGNMTVTASQTKLASGAPLPQGTGPVGYIHGGAAGVINSRSERETDHTAV
jgi:hypothetical protein